MLYFTHFQDQLFPTAELSRTERDKIDNFLRLLEESGVYTKKLIRTGV